MGMSRLLNGVTSNIRQIFLMIVFVVLWVLLKRNVPIVLTKINHLNQNELCLPLNVVYRSYFDYRSNRLQSSFAANTLSIKYENKHDTQIYVCVLFWLWNMSANIKQKKSSNFWVKNPLKVLEFDFIREKLFCQWKVGFHFVFV